MQDIIRKIQKLLNLSRNNPSQHEAEAAAEKAQELIARHNISKIMLDIEQDNVSNSPDAVREKIYSSGRVATWVGVLSSGVASANYCAMYRQPGWGLICVGEPEDVEMVKFLLNALVCEVEYLAKLECKKRYMNKSEGRVFANNFKMGAAHSLRIRLEATTKKIETELTNQDSGKMVLAVVGNKLEKVKKAMPTLRKAPTVHYRGHADGYAAGRKAGNSMSLKPSKKLEG